jgi:hypothetical protein
MALRIIRGPSLLSGSSTYVVPPHGPQSSHTYPYALLDEIVLVRLQLMLQLVLLSLNLARLLLGPRRVNGGGGVLGGNFGEALGHAQVELDILALLCLGDGSPPCVYGQVCRVRANVHQAFEARVAVVVGYVGFEVEFGRVCAC